MPIIFEAVHEKVDFNNKAGAWTEGVNFMCGRYDI